MYIFIHLFNFVRPAPWVAAASRPPRLILGAPGPRDPPAAGLPTPRLPAKINVKNQPKASSDCWHPPVSPRY